MKLLLFSDGGARNNPGPAGCGFVVYTNEMEILAEGSKFLGVLTNNQAEYHGLILGLEAAVNQGFEELRCHLDSELIVKQLLGEYRVKHPDLIPLYKQVQDLITEKKVGFMHIPRRKNAYADRLANEAMDEGEKLL